MSESAPIAEWARATLLKLSELNLPPTPENYAKWYALISGIPRREMSEASRAACEEMVQAVKDLAESLVSRAQRLEQELAGDNAALRETAGYIRASEGQATLMQLMETLLSKADAIYTRVDSACSDVESTRSALAHLTEELVQTRQALQEDPLTGAYNRRGMDAVLLREVARARRNHNRLVVAMLDVDHFKQINDAHGHDAGDKLLVHLTTVMRSALREADVLVRYGGEEFLLILSDADLRGARFVVDRLRQVIAKAPLHYEGKRIEVTVSVGIAQLQENENGQNLVLRADHALYEAKRAGRNCVREAD